MTYNCASMVERAIRRIPENCFDQVICADDGSTDDTVAVVEKLGIPVYSHPHEGYGGNLYFGWCKAVELGATYVFELHGDGQYDFGVTRDAIDLLADGYHLVLGNRFHPDIVQPLRDGMDLARYLGNIGITTIARIGLGIPSRDLFPGFRAYSRTFIETIDATRAWKNYGFSFDIIAQARYCGLRIGQIPVRCDYKLEHSTPALWRGMTIVFHTCYTVTLYRLACINIKRGIFTSLVPRKAAP
jgi:glycosyltransferase involved in cell wall biosynthesis